MGLTSIYDEPTLQRVKAWMANAGELLVELNYPHSGGSGTYYFVASFTDLTDMIEQARSGAIFYIYRRQQFPIRGNVDDPFIQRVMNEIPDGEWYLYTQLDFYPMPVSYGSGNTHTELRTDLEDYRGTFVCVGRDPATLESQYINNGDLIVAQKL